jgi:hypothetical protein
MKTKHKAERWWCIQTPTGEIMACACGNNEEQAFESYWRNVSVTSFGGWVKRKQDEGYIAVRIEVRRSGGGRNG